MRYMECDWISLLQEKSGADVRRRGMNEEAMNRLIPTQKPTTTVRYKTTDEERRSVTTGVSLQHEVLRTNEQKNRDERL